MEALTSSAWWTPGLGLLLGTLCLLLAEAERRRR